jgi:hypothetical protein
MIARPLLDQGNGNVKIARHDIIDPRNRLIEDRLEQFLARAESQSLLSRPLPEYEPFFDAIGSIRTGASKTIISFFSSLKVIEMIVRIKRTNLEISSTIRQLEEAHCEVISRVRRIQET